MRPSPRLAGLVFALGAWASLSPLACSENDSATNETSGPGKPPGAGGSSGKGGAGGGGGSSGKGASSGKGGQAGSGASAGAGSGGSPAKGGSSGQGGSSGTSGSGGTQASAGSSPGGVSGASGASGTAGAAGAAGSAGGPPADPCAGVTCSGHGTCVKGACQCEAGYVAQGTSCSLPTETCSEVACPAGSHCEGGLCYCDDASVPPGNGCWPKDPGDPTSHSQAAVCAAWKAGRVVTDESPWKPGPGGDCDPGTLSKKGINDTLNRLAMYRWLVGLVPAPEDAQKSLISQYGAVLASWNPPGVAPDPHHPPPSAKCYTDMGLQGTSTSSLGWGTGHPANAVDGYIQDGGNASTFGHRRWALHPPLGPIGVGYYAGGGGYGNCQCMTEFPSSNPHPPRPVYTWPPAGYVPLAAAQMAWSYHNEAGVGDSPQVTVKAASDPATTLGVMIYNLGYGYGDPAVAWDLSFFPKAGETYQVTVEGVPDGPYSYEIKPINCD